VKRLATAALALVLCCPSIASAQQGVLTVDANVALTSLMTIADGHLQSMAGALEALALTNGARAAQWTRIERGLQRIAGTQVPAVLFFANRQGTDWTMDGKQMSIADRPYFAEVMKGHVSIGDLVISRSTGKPVAIVAVPIVGDSGTVVGLLGASVYLDLLSARIRREMGIGPNDLFWAIDPHGIIALHSDPTNVFVEPAKLSAALKGTMESMLQRDEGTQTYEYRGHTRTVIFRKSNVTQWRYGFGVIR
jgi:methyl-accepting chemotaxis protein